MERPLRSVKLAVLAAALSVSAARAGGLSDLLPGGRPAGMGFAYTAVSDDVWGMFYNPAGLARTPFPTAGLSLGRQLSPLGPVNSHAWAYTRPFPIRPGSTIGAGWYGLQQAGGGEKNELLFHYSDTLTVPRLFITKPFAVGGNFKFAQVAGRGESNAVSPALDGGVLFDTPNDTRIGLSITDLAPMLKVPVPSINLGTSWSWQRRVLLAADLRVRPGLTQFFPGVEVGFFQRLLKVRMGKGMPLDGVGQLAFGLGVDYSPLLLDFSMSMPSGGWNREGGAFHLTAQWRFGAPDFYGRFVGTAARRAEDLRSEIDELERKRLDAAAKAKASEADAESVTGQVRAQEERLRQLREDSRNLETDIERRRYDLGHPPPEAPAPAAPAPRPAAKPSPKRAPAPSFPLRHLVKPGDTLRRLADLYYGDGSLWEQIYDANADKVERGLPVEGSTLLVPAPRRR